MELILKMDENLQMEPNCRHASFRSATKLRFSYPRTQHCLTILCVALFVLIAVSPASYASTFSAVQSGDWEDPDTWNHPVAPTAGDQVLTLAGHEVTITADATIGSGIGAALSNGNNSELILAEGVTLTVNGDFVQNGYASDVVLHANSAILFNPAIDELFQYRRTTEHQHITFAGKANERARIGLTATAEGGYFISTSFSRDQLLRGSFGRIEDSFDPVSGRGMQISLNNTPGVSSLVAQKIEFIRCGSIRVIGNGAGENTEVDIDAWTFRDPQFAPDTTEPAFWFDGYLDADVVVADTTLTTKSVTNIVSDAPINMRFVQGYTLDNYVLDSSPANALIGNVRSSNLGGNALSHNNVFRADAGGGTALNLLATSNDTSYFYAEAENSHGWSTQQLRGDALLSNFWFETNQTQQADTPDAILTSGPQISATLNPSSPATTLTVENSGTIGDSSADAQHASLISFNISEGICLLYTSPSPRD